jgi:hypothetical protein
MKESFHGVHRSSRAPGHDSSVLVSFGIGTLVALTFSRDRDGRRVNLLTPKRNHNKHNQTRACSLFRLEQRGTSVKQRMLAVMGAVALLAIGAAAEAQVTMGEPTYGGNGCPAGSVGATLSPDQKSLSILFDQYVLEAGRNIGKTIDRKSCNLAIPIHVPAGYSLTLFKTDYRGYNVLPRSARAQFSVEYFFAGSRGPRSVKTFMGPRSDAYQLSDTLGAAALVIPCGGANTNLRVNTSMLLTNSTWEDALSTVDSADVTAGLVYHLQIRRCW